MDYKSVTINKLRMSKNSYGLLIGNHKIDSENSVTSLGIEIDNKLNFGRHVTTLCQKTGCQLNALSRMHKYIELQEMKMLLDSFILPNLTIVPLWGISALPPYHRKYTKNVEYRNVLRDYWIMIANPVTTAYN